MREVSKVDLNIATEHQRIAIDKIIDFMKSPNQLMTLEGFGGTGKSFIVNMIVEHFIYNNGYAVGIGALTHKAVFVLTRMAEFHSENLEYKTIHSILGVKPWMDDKGGEHFIKDKKAECRVGDYDIIIVDEASMLDDKLFSYLMEELENSPETKVLFVGDSKQLPPVNQTRSIPMDKDMRGEYNIQYATLKEIIRQKGTNPIIPLSKGLRKGVYEFKTELNDDKEGVILVPKNKQAKVMRSLFCSDKFEENTDYCRLVSWRNNQVDYYNSLIRKMIYKDKIRTFVTENRDDPNYKKAIVEKYPFFNIETQKVAGLPDYIKGDKVITDKPVFHEDGSTIIFNTNEELIIDEITTVSEFFKGEEYKIYQAQVTNIWDNKKRNVIPIIHESSKRKLDLNLEKLKQLAKKEKQPQNARRRWIEYYQLDKKFAKLKYLPSMTTYKSQGSTYENVIVNLADIDHINKRSEKLQHLYVGVTRASKRVYVFS